MKIHTSEMLSNPKEGWSLQYTKNSIRVKESKFLNNSFIFQRATTNLNWHAFNKLKIINKNEHKLGEICQTHYYSEKFQFSLVKKTKYYLKHGFEQ